MKNWKVYERHVAKLFRQWYPDARRGMQSQEGTYVPDVVAKDIPYYVECKSGYRGIHFKPDGKTVTIKPWCDNPSVIMGMYEDRMYRYHQESGNGEWPVLIVWRVTNHSGAQDWIMMRDDNGDITSLEWDTFVNDFMPCA